MLVADIMIVLSVFDIITLGSVSEVAEHPEQADTGEDAEVDAAGKRAEH